MRSRSRLIVVAWILAAAACTTTTVPSNAPPPPSGSDRTATHDPAPSDSPPPSPPSHSASTPSATATPPDSRPVLGDISDLVLTYSLPDDYLELNGVYDVDSYGSRIVYIDLYGERGGIGQTVWLVELETGERTALNEVRGRVVVLGPAISGDDVVWSADRNVGSRALEWQIVHHDLATGATRIVDDGINRRFEDGSPSAPATDVDDGLVVYTVESPTDKWPYGWKVLVRHLSNGTLEREIQTRYSVWDLAVDDGNVLYSEVPPSEADGGAPAVMLSTAANPEPAQVALNGGSLSIDRERLVWAGIPDFVVGAPAIGQEVLTATFSDLSPTRLNGPIDDGFGGRNPAAGDGMVVWNEPAEAWDNLFMWDSESNHSYQIAGHDNTLSHRFSTYLPNIDGGWLTWSVIFATQTHTLVQFSGITTDDLRAAQPHP